jgi:hypothetical protein
LLLSCVAVSQMTDADAAVLAGIRKAIAADPCLKLLDEYRIAHPHLDRMDIRTVEDALAEKALWAMLLASDEGGFLSDSEEGQHANQRRWVSSLFMLKAVPYVWNSDMFVMVANSTLPRHTIAARIPFDVIWFSFRDRFPLGFDDVQTPGNFGVDNHSNLCADGIMAVQIPQFGAIPARVRLSLLGAREDEAQNSTPFCYTFDIPQGSIYPDDFPGNSRRLVGMFLACLSFINSPYIVLDRKTMCRQARRRVGVGGGFESHAARFISLRSPLAKRDHEGSESSVDWKHRWLVSGHHRAQWCPSTQDHKLIWIAPYIKGPEDAPMKTRAYKVVQ